jgi:hypothetical protein
VSSSAIRSHWWPRTRKGRIAALAFLGTLALAQPPIVFVFANRIEPWVFGMPFLYAYLTTVYTVLCGLLLMVWRWRL